MSFPVMSCDVAMLPEIVAERLQKSVGKLPLDVATVKTTAMVILVLRIFYPYRNRTVFIATLHQLTMPELTSAMTQILPNNTSGRTMVWTAWIT